MSESTNVSIGGGEGTGQGGPQVQLPIDGREAQTTYTNFFRVTGTTEELVLDFGLHTQMMTPTGPEPVKLTNRVVLSFYTAKRLLNALQWAISRHENSFGAIEVEPQKRLRPSVRGAGGFPTS